ncbi:hypothetical protein ABT160_41310 [Streptomyces sp. NPDC001941]|uniref:hypothetical protein n=1 Tax=Streptomyces sp. NPDC001941 TaxID=3154659 RepID=UPI003317099F
MRSLKIATGTVLASAALLLAAPTASASDTQCDPATAAAMEAESAYKAALADYQKIINDGGHPDKSQQDNVAQLKQKADSTASEAQRICGDTVVNPTTPPEHHKPSGAMHTGSGSTSGSLAEGTDSATAAATAAGVAGLALVGAGVWRRRRGAGDAG